MPGKAPRQKGDRLEREAVEALRSAGLDAHRIPLSGAQKGFPGDVELRLKSGRKSLEAKSRKTGLSKLYEWLGTNYALIVKQDRCEMLAVLPLAELARLIKRVEDAEMMVARVNDLSATIIESPHPATTAWDQIVKARTQGIPGRTYMDVSGRYYTSRDGKAVLCDMAGNPLREKA